MQRHKRPGTDQEGEWAAPNEIRWFDSYRDRRDFARCCAGDLFARWTGGLATLKGAWLKARATASYVLGCGLKTPSDLPFWLGIACSVGMIALGVTWITLLFLGFA